MFVTLPPIGDALTYHIIWRRELAGIVNERHTRWLATPGRGGQMHSTKNPIRKFVDIDGQYRDGWDALGL